MHEDLYDVHQGSHRANPYISRGQDRRLHRRLDRQHGQEHGGLSREHGYRHAELRDDHDAYHDDDYGYDYGNGYGNGYSGGGWRGNNSATYFELQYRR